MYFHVIPGQPSMAALTAAGSAETFLDELTSGGEMLRFSANGSQARRGSHHAAFVVCVAIALPGGSRDRPEVDKKQCKDVAALCRLMLALSPNEDWLQCRQTQVSRTLACSPSPPIVALQIAVSGRVANNSAVMPNAMLGYPCSAVFVIDTVLLPAPTLADVPPFSAIRAPPLTHALSKLLP